MGAEETGAVRLRDLVKAFRTFREALTDDDATNRPILGHLAFLWGEICAELDRE